MTQDGELAELTSALIAKTKEMEGTDHVGHYNRLFRQRERIYEQILALPGGKERLTRLFEHADPMVQLEVARHCRYKRIDFDAAWAALQRLSLRPDAIGRTAKSSLQIQPWENAPPSPPRPQRIIPFVPAPRGCSRNEAENMIRAQFAPEPAARIGALLRPAIRLWPKPSSGSLLASRYGGMPAVPNAWQWPIENEEPMLFLAQINCAELGNLAKALGLPHRGLLSFFGDYADVNGCGEYGGGQVYYFADMLALVAADLPLEDFEPLPTCGMDFCETWEVPDSSSEAADALNLSEEDRDRYHDLYSDLACFGFDRIDDVDPFDISKLLGWPDLVQGDIYGADPEDPQLLLQLGSYRDGTEVIGWGPGGLLYFMLRRDDLAVRAFENVELIVQCT